MYCDEIFNFGGEWTWLGTADNVESVFLRLIQVVSATLQVTFVAVYLIKRYFKLRQDEQAKGSLRERKGNSNIGEQLLRFGTNRTLFPLYRYLIYVTLVFMLARAVLFSVELWVIGFAPSHDTGINNACPTYSKHSLFTGNPAKRFLISLFRSLVYAGYETLVLNSVSLSLVELTSGTKTIRRVFIISIPLSLCVAFLSFFAHYTSSFETMVALSLVINLLQVILTLYVAYVLFKRCRKRTQKLLDIYAHSASFKHSTHFNGGRNDMRSKIVPSQSNLDSNSIADFVSIGSWDMTSPMFSEEVSKTLPNNSHLNESTHERQPLVERSHDSSYGSVKSPLLNNTSHLSSKTHSVEAKEDVKYHITGVEYPGGNKENEVEEDDDAFGSDIEDGEVDTTETRDRVVIKDTGSLRVTQSHLGVDDKYNAYNSHYEYQALSTSPQVQPGLVLTESNVQPHSFSSRILSPSPSSQMLGNSTTFTSLPSHSPDGLDLTLQTSQSIIKGRKLPMRVRLGILWLGIVGSYFMTNLIAYILFMARGAYCGFPLCPVALSTLLLCVLIPFCLVYIFRRDTRSWNTLHGLISTCGAESTSIRAASAAALRSGRITNGSKSSKADQLHSSNNIGLERSYSSANLTKSNSTLSFQTFVGGEQALHSKSPQMGTSPIISSLRVGVTNNERDVQAPQSNSPYLKFSMEDVNLGSGNSPSQPGSFILQAGSMSSAVALGSIPPNRSESPALVSSVDSSGCLIRSPSAQYTHTDGNIGIAGTPIAAAAAVAAIAAVTQSQHKNQTMHSQQSQSQLKMAPSASESQMKSVRDPVFSVTNPDSTCIVMETSPGLASDLLKMHHHHQSLQKQQESFVNEGVYVGKSGISEVVAAARRKELLDDIELERSLQELAIDDQEFGDVDIEDWLSMNGINVIPEAQLQVDDRPLGVGANAQVVKALWFPGNESAAAAATAAAEARGWGDNLDPYTSDYGVKEEASLSKIVNGKRKSQMHVVALKQVYLPVSHDHTRPNEFLRAVFSFCREVAVSQPLMHENVVQLLGIVVNQERGEFALALEFCSHGSLASLIQAFVRGKAKARQRRQNDATAPKESYPKIRFTWRAKLKIALSIAKGLKYLHEHKIVHRDLKTDNVLIHFPNQRESEDFCLDLEFAVAKLADFGHARGIMSLPNGPSEPEFGEQLPSSTSPKSGASISSLTNRSPNAGVQIVIPQVQNDIVGGSSEEKNGDNAQDPIGPDRLYADISEEISKIRQRSRLLDLSLLHITGKSIQNGSNEAKIDHLASSVPPAAIAAAAAADATTTRSGEQGMDEHDSMTALGSKIGNVMSVHIGTQLYSAPEILFASLEGEPTAFYGYSADVYSYGVILWEIVRCLQPFAELNAWDTSQFCLAIVGGYRPPIPNSSPIFVGTEEQLRSLEGGDTVSDAHQDCSDFEEADKDDFEGKQEPKLFWKGTLLSKRLLWDIIQRCWDAKIPLRPSFDHIVLALESLLELHELETKLLRSARVWR